MPRVYYCPDDHDTDEVRYTTNQPGALNPCPKCKSPNVVIVHNIETASWHVACDWCGYAENPRGSQLQAVYVWNVWSR